jgi:hypothetical protein
MDEEHDDYIPTTFLKTRIIKKCRKPFRCEMCEKLRPIGSEKSEHYMIQEGYFYTLRYCHNNPDCIKSVFNETE